ncbi:transcriptional regulator with XRE-family HTH domain [Actinopolyspora biskrensis]|uniref:Transcriptional regulator with XRE-family HTH domain n=1 Tax=Actinopolyspora biskrensis TaxID=1470178 RepID=A0A852Z2G7_9ACTN|nr:helix-turn-helix transcriptional regulator [Actinopolyspora biskrensis]NYH80728.1 transcriptional regulator with XRE-family HTH domain [Actinopolyspora biskrensis]
MTGTTNLAPRAYILGSELRKARQQAGFTLRKMATQLDVSHSVVVRWERGGRVPSTESVSALCAVLELPSHQRERLLDLTREAAAEPVNSVSVGATGEGDQLTALLEFERTATTITDVSPLLMPGLLQTGDYAQAIMGTGVPNVDERVTLRLGRRDVITRRRAPVNYTAFILESVLHQPVGDNEVMNEQLWHLIEMGQRDNIEVRVIPQRLGWTPAHAGPFMLLEFERASPVVHLEHHRSSAFLRDEGDVSAFIEAREDIDRLAMSAQETRELIADATERLETT